MKTALILAIAAVLGASAEPSGSGGHVEVHPVPVAVPAAVHGVQLSQRTQYHAQNDATDEYIYGYVEPNGAKEERKLADGTVLGSYSYASPDGGIITNNYVADDQGFRSNLAPTLHKDNAYAIAGAAAEVAPAVVAYQHEAPLVVASPAPPVVVHHQQHHHVQRVVEPVPVAVPVPVVKQHVVHHEVIDHPPQVHVQQQSYHGSDPQVHHSKEYAHGVSIHKKTYADSQPVIHQQVKTIVDPKPIVVSHHGTTYNAAPVHHGDHHVVAVTASPAPIAYASASPVAYASVTPAPAVAYERSVVSPTPAAHIHETHYHKPATVLKKAYVGPYGQHVEKTYAEPAVSIKKTVVDENPTLHFETSYHEDHGAHTKVVKQTVVDPRPVTTIEKRVHGIPVVQAYEAVPVVHHTYIEEPVVKVHKEVVPVYAPKPYSEPIFYGSYGYPGVRLAKKFNTYVPRRAHSSVHFKQYFPKKHGYGYGHGHHSGSSRRHYGYGPSRRSYGGSSRRQYYINHH